MKRIVFHVTEEMGKALAVEARRRRAPTAAVIRDALEEYFRSRGVEMDGTIEWGKKSEESEDPNQVAYATH